MEEFELEPGERVVLTVRKHWFVFVVGLLPFVVMAIIPFFIPNFLHGFEKVAPAYSSFSANLTLANPIVRLVLGLWWLVLWIGAFNFFTQYYLNHWAVTTARIVRVKQHGFFNREVSSFLLSHVQDVSTTVDGIFADLLGYGSVQVETAGTASSHFIMDGIADPQGMRDLIMKEIALLHADNHTAHP